MSRPITLIIPPSIFLLDERVFMTLGILRIAAVLEKSNFAIEVLDLSGVENYEEVVKIHATNCDSECFALTATTPQIPATAKILQAIRSARPLAKTILGGPHITLVCAALKREKKLGLQGRAHSAFAQLSLLFDVLVAGDGEHSIFLAIAPNAPKFIDGDSPKSELFLTNQQLSSLPFPARHLVDVKSYHYSIDGVPALSMIAQLGCPFACGFCGGRESPMLRYIRTRSSESVVEEMEHIYHAYGIKGFMLYDDELNVNPKMVDLMRSIRKLQDKLGVEFRLRGFIKSQLFTDVQAEAMYAAGFRWILTGFESGSPRILKNINKRATREENTRCMDIAKRHNLKVKALMSIGHPGESEETVQQTHDWLLENRPEDFDVTIITTYPGTPYYDYAVAHPTEKNIWIYTFEATGDRLYSQEVDYTQIADYYKGDPDGGYKAYVYTDYLSSEQIVTLRDYVEKSIREKLNIPFNQSTAAIRFEHSMGQTPLLPSHILRKNNQQEV